MLGVPQTNPGLKHEPAAVLNQAWALNQPQLTEGETTSRARLLPAGAPAELPSAKAEL